MGLTPLKQPTLHPEAPRNRLFKVCLELADRLHLLAGMQVAALRPASCRIEPSLVCPKGLFQGQCVLEEPEQIDWGL